VEAACFQQTARSWIRRAVDEDVVEAERIRREWLLRVDGDDFETGKLTGIDPLRIQEQRPIADLRDGGFQMQAVLESDRHGVELLNGSHVRALRKVHI